MDDIHAAYIMAHENAIIYAPKDDKETLTRLCKEAIAEGWRCYGFPVVDGMWVKQIVIRDHKPS